MKGIMKDIRRRPMLIVMAVALLALTACGSPGVSNEDAEAIRDDLATVRERLDEIEQQVDSLETGDADREEIAAAVREALEDARQRTDQAREDLEEPEPEPIDEGAGDPLAPADDGAPAF